VLPTLKKMRECFDANRIDLSARGRQFSPPCLFQQPT
jgi:hypothetical protein